IDTCVVPLIENLGFELSSMSIAADVSIVSVVIGGWSLQRIRSHKNISGVPEYGIGWTTSEIRGLATGQVPGIGVDNIRSIEHEVPNRCDDEIVDITDYEDSDQMVKEDIDISVTKEKEEVQVEDVIFDEDYALTFYTTEETLQWSLGKQVKSGLVGYHVDDDDRIICDDGCCSRKQTWSMAWSMLSLHHAEQIQGSFFF
ncbi:hypothetical protein Tco_0040143, partial [Tanacetum coccineum]